MEISTHNPGHLPNSHPSFCPSCGQRLDVKIQTFDYKTLHRSFHIFTCRNRDCTVYGRTCSNKDLADLLVLAQWHTTQYFDVESGQVLEKPLTARI